MRSIRRSRFVTVALIFGILVVHGIVQAAPALTNGPYWRLFRTTLTPGS